MYRGAVIAAIAVAIVFSLTFFDDPIQGRATLVAAICLILWLFEVVPPYVPTLVLWAMTVMLLGPMSKEFSLTEVLKWAANPVLLLFFGGFTFGVAAARFGLDTFISQLVVKWARGKSIYLILLVVSATAFMSMWMSNIAAAAMMIASLHPITSKMPLDAPLRKALLLSIAVGANFGGIATPIGTGPNALAIAAVSKHHPVTFADWMSFSLPLTAGLIAIAILMLVFIYRIKGSFAVEQSEIPNLSKSAKVVVLIFSLTIAAWLTESFHGISAAVIALIAAATLFGSGLLKRNDLNSIDWGTMALIAGGVSLGNLLEQADLINFWTDKIAWGTMPLIFQVFIVCFLSALLAALMSNTATVTVLIPFALGLIPNPAIAILVAVSASFGTPFVISTPINAMVHGEGGITARDLFQLGFPLMILGCLITALTGFYFLSFWLY